MLFHLAEKENNARQSLTFPFITPQSRCINSQQHHMGIIRQDIIYHMMDLSQDLRCGLHDLEVLKRKGQSRCNRDLGLTKHGKRTSGASGRDDRANPKSDLAITTPQFRERELIFRVFGVFFIIYEVFRIS
jgi:hypothetical protein